MSCTQLNSNGFAVYLHKQTDCGVIGPNPEFKLFRRVSGKARTTQSFIESSETKVSRQARQQIADTKEFGAELEFVLTEDLVGYLENALYGTFSTLTNINLTDVDFNSTTLEISSVTGGFLGLPQQGYVYIEFAAPEDFLSNFFYVTVIDDNTLQLKPSTLFGDLTGITATFKASTLESGKENKYLAVQTRVGEGVNEAVETIQDCLVNNLTITVPTSGEITGSLGLVGSSATDIKYAGQTDAAPDTSDVLTATNSLSKVIVDHIEGTDAGVSEFSLEFNNNVSTTNRAGFATSNVVTPSNITVTGTFNTIAESGAPFSEYDKYKAGQDFAITIPLVVSSTDNKLLFVTIEKAKYTALEQNDSGNEIVVNSGTYAGQESAGGYTVKIDKNF
jgi:hypothetical protein